MDDLLQLQLLQPLEFKVNLMHKFWQETRKQINPHLIYFLIPKAFKCG